MTTGAKVCDHKFIGTKHCVKCGWVPNAAAIVSRITPMRLVPKEKEPLCGTCHEPTERCLCVEKEPS